MKTTFTIKSKPITKQRPRFSKKSNSVYTPTQTKIFENIVKFCYGNRYFYDKEYIKVYIIFKFEIPKSYSKKKYSDAIKGKIRPTKADIDNYIKAVLDGLNKVAYSDDRYISKIEAEKVFAEESEIIVTIENV